MKYIVIKECFDIEANPITKAKVGEIYNDFDVKNQTLCFQDLNYPCCENYECKKCLIDKEIIKECKE